MSTPWRITHGEDQFTIENVAELKLAAAKGRIQFGDLVQAPGRSDWRYAMEVPELKGLVKQGPVDDDDLGGSRSSGNTVRIALLLVALAGVGAAFYSLYWIMNNAPDASDNALFRDGEGGMGPLDALATEYANLLAEPDSRASKVGEVPKDSRVQLIRKMGDFYEVKLEDGSTGWLGTGQVVAGYKFNAEAMRTYDPLFNPDAYLQLTNYSWVPRGDPKEPETLTDMLFEVNNPTDYGMQGVTLRVTFRDGNDQVITTKDIEVPRLVPPHETLFLDGIEVDLQWDEDSTAKVVIFGARALLPAEYSKLKAEEEARLADEAEEEGDGKKKGMRVSGGGGGEISFE